MQSFKSNKSKFSKILCWNFLCVTDNTHSNSKILTRALQCIRFCTIIMLYWSVLKIYWYIPTYLFSILKRLTSYELDFLNVYSLKWSCVENLVLLNHNKEKIGRLFWLCLAVCNRSFGKWLTTGQNPVFLYYFL